MDNKIQGIPFGFLGNVIEVSPSENLITIVLQNKKIVKVRDN